MSRCFLWLAYAVSISLPAAAAQDLKTLTGELSGRFKTAEYIISGAVTVPRGKTLSFDAGSVLRFENFSGITVLGSFECKGTPGRSVIFTSINDGSDSGAVPEPFDWNGIKVASGAVAVTLEECMVAYSTFGISIESVTAPVTLTNVIFHHNGSASLTVEKKMMPVTENTPASFIWPQISAGSKGTNSNKLNTGRTALTGPAWKRPIRISSAAAAVGGLALWMTGFLCAEHYCGLITPGTPIEQARDYKESWNSWVAVRNTGIGLFCTGAAGFAVTFVF